MLLLFHKGKFIREAAGHELNKYTMPNDSWLYSTKNDVWWHRIIDRYKVIPAHEVPANYKAMVLLLT